MSVKLDTSVLDRMIAKLGSNADEATKGAAYQVMGHAGNLAPYDTGALSNSIHVEKQGDSLYWVADQVEYGIWQELGTSKIAAQPFMVPAIEATARDMARLYGSVLE